MADQQNQQQQQSPTDAELAQVRYALRTYGGPYGQRLAEQLPVGASVPTQPAPRGGQQDSEQEA